MADIRHWSAILTDQPAAYWLRRDDWVVHASVWRQRMIDARYPHRAVILAADHAQGDFDANPRGGIDLNRCTITNVRNLYTPQGCVEQDPSLLLAKIHLLHGGVCRVNLHNDKVLT